MAAMTEPPRNPFAGTPFTDDDETIAAMLEDVSVPALLCSLVHMTGDPSWLRGEERPRALTPMEVQAMMAPEDLAAVRAKALPAIVAYRDGGCVPSMPPPEVVQEMMDFLAVRPVPDDVAPMMLEELRLDGTDARAPRWGDEVPAAVRSDAHVVVIGCGESGIVAGIRLAEAGLPFTIVEKSDGPGGTWRDNRYPGARVDVGSHHYSYSFEPSDSWSEYFCRQPELQAYFEGVVDKHGLAPHCRFDTEVTGAAWDESSARWHVTVRAGDGSTETIVARFVISAVGSLNLPKLPAFEGMDSFAGPSFHSARWPRDLDIAGKRFGLVGAGATGFQIAPTIADEVAHLSIFQRTTQWMFPNPTYHQPVPPGDAWAMQHLPFYGRWFRFMMMYPGVASSTTPYKRDRSYHDPDGPAINAANTQRRGQLTAWITSHLEGRPDLIEKSIPPYPPSGKRMLQDDGSWLRCLTKPNVDFVKTPIERIVPEGVVTADGVVHEVDVICYATGFRANEYLAPIEITGRDGASLRKVWGDEPTAYLGITVPGFPNLFLVYGPGTNLAHGASLIFHSECQVRYTMDAIHEVLASGARSIEVRRDVHQEYARRYRAEIDELIWAHEDIEHSHYKNPAGKIFSLSPWPMEVYWAWTRAVDPADFVVT
jgi:4-hydroxyacetophenone monooxygenase